MSKPGNVSFFAATLGLFASLLVAVCAGQVEKIRHIEEETGGPDEAFQWRRLAWLDENGSFNPKDAVRAREQRDANAQYWAAQGLVESADWVSRGPTNIMGRTRSLVIRPDNPNIMFAGTVGGGVWKTTNGGASWNRIDDRWKSIAIGCLTIDPANPDVMYAGTGEGYFNGDAIPGAGIYKTIDGGDTWTLLPGSTSFGNVCRIAISPSDSNTLLASVRYGGIYRSINGGDSWNNVYSAQGSYFVAFNPNDSSKAIAHVIDYGSDWLHRAMYSTDGGQTWNIAASGLTQVDAFGNRLELAYAPSNPNIVYANVASSSGKIWKSTDGGVNYSLVTTSGNIGSGWYYCPIWVDPTNANTLIAGGVHCYRSTNGGVTMTKISNGYIMTAQAHPDQHLYVQHPGYNGTTNRTVFACTDGGVYKATDITTASQTSGWTNLDQTVPTTQYYGADGDGTSGRIIGGTQDNGHHTINNGSSNALLTFGGDGGFAALDWLNPLYGYGEYVYLQIHRSTDGGNSANYIDTGITDSGSGSTANFIAPFILDPNNPLTMLAGGRSLWRTTNVRAGTPAWSAIRPAGTSNMSAIAVAPGNSNIIYVGQNGGIISKTINGTVASPTWTVVDDNSGTNPLPDRTVTRIFVDPSDSNVVYVALGGFSPDNLWKSTNGGTNWTDITGSGVTGLPDAPIRGFSRHPSQPNWLFAGTEVGLFQSQDGGATWSTSDFGPINTAIYECKFMANSYTLLVATHGRGLWTASLPDPFVNATSLTMFRGSIMSGTLADTYSSNDVSLAMRPGSVLSSVEYPIQAIFESTSPFQTPGTASVTVETSATVPNLQQIVEAWDFTAGAYEQLDSRVATVADTSLMLPLANPARFVEAGTKKVRLRVRWKANGATLVFPWQAKIDTLNWSVWP